MLELALARFTNRQSRNAVTVALAEFPKTTPGGMSVSLAFLACIYHSRSQSNDTSRLMLRR